MTGSGKKIGSISVVYWLVTGYMVAALAWWFIELMQLNNQLHAFRKDLIRSSAISPAQIEQVEEEHSRNIIQYIGEGSMFLLLTLLGAGFVHRTARKRFQLDGQQRNFMMAVTHELKTPIAIIRLNLETLLKHSLDDKKRNEILNANLRESDRLEDLCNKILLSSKYDAGNVAILREIVELSSLVRETLQEYIKRYPERTFIAEIPGEINIMADKLLISLALNNLIENAVRYSPPDSPIRIVLDRSATTNLSVADEGKGIPHDEKQKLFQKFYRIGREEIRKEKGTGLGLYLTKRIAMDHGGSVQVEDNHPKGSKFIIRLPNLTV